MKHLKYNMRSRLWAILAAFSLISFSACSDLLDTESDRQAFDPDLNAKTDSVFYALGIAQSMQQLADQYFFQGEMRGELVATTQHTDSMLSQLKDFSAGLTNRYDSAYVYYRVINNCNYYLAHRDTTLITGSTHVALPEYAAVLAFRAWAYLQLCRNYGEVPFFTEPLTAISQIDNNQFPSLGIEAITTELETELLRFATFDTPVYGATGVGSTNSGITKNVSFQKVFIPAGVILGDLYLECGRYAEAAKAYTDYLIANKKVMPNIKASDYLSFASFRQLQNYRGEDLVRPTDVAPNSGGTVENLYTNLFPDAGTATTPDLVSYIPMAVNKVSGATTRVPYAFGYDFYSLTTPWVEDIQLVPSADYRYLTDNQTYYYKYTPTGNSPTNGINDVKAGVFGDFRTLDILYTRQGTVTLDAETEDITWIDKFRAGNIILYRLTTVYLHLCEALNRMGMPDLAFGLLKEGVNASLMKQVTPQSLSYLNTTFLSEASNETFLGKSYGIHQHGAGATSDAGMIGSSPYQFDAQVDSMLNVLSANAELYPGLKLRLDNSRSYKADYAEAYAEAYAAWLAAQEAAESEDTPAEGEGNAPRRAEGDDDDADDSAAGEGSDDTPATPQIVVNINAADYEPLLTQADTIMAVEELLCDEEAMEFCFEGTRWYDLMRFARHKNRAGLAGNAWLANKVRNNQPTKDLTNEQNWYLPFKKK